MFTSRDRELLREIYEPESDGEASFALTERGLWHPTPLDVLLPALLAVSEAGWLGSASRALTLLDAGSGDGRVVAALSVLRGLSARSRILGLEADEQLDRSATEALARFEKRRYAQTTVGDFLSEASYEVLGLRPSEIHVFLNYPDGNEQALAAFLAREAPSARLVALTPDRRFDLEALALRSSLEVTPQSVGPCWEARLFGAP